MKIKVEKIKNSLAHNLCIKRIILLARLDFFEKRIDIYSHFDCLVFFKMSVLIALSNHCEYFNERVCRHAWEG